MKNEEKYIIPKNVKSEKMAWNGVSMRNFGYTIGTMIVTGILFFLVGQFKIEREILEFGSAKFKMVPIIPLYLRVSIIVFPTSLIFLGHKKNRQGFSMFDLIKRKQNFAKSQKKYYYTKGDRY